MPSFRVSSKHHRRINNPFPGKPKTLPYVHGNLFYNEQNLTKTIVFPIGGDFQIIWSSINGGYVSVVHKSQPEKSIWSSIPGEAFVSAAIAETEVEESRGSFAIKDRKVSSICNRQYIENVKLINGFLDCKETLDWEHSNGHLRLEEYNDFSNQLVNVEFPLVLIIGFIFKRKDIVKFNLKRTELESKVFHIEDIDNLDAVARYWVCFDQKNRHEIGFGVKIGKLSLFQKRSIRNSVPSFRILMNNLSQFQKRYLSCLPNCEVFLSIPSKDEADDEKDKVFAEFNRIVITYSSENDEKFFGFGEQFTHMEFKGKRVPIFVQEQGIGRGDQPITLAANLVSYRSGGDSCTTYAPSPFYVTSKMRSLYLEGYSYSVFDLTKPDKIQIQMHGNSIYGRILHGQSPTELIERFTETNGRLPELPEWIISGAVVGMQGGTEAVRSVWKQLQDYDVPVSAFWLQDWVGQRETIIGSQLWWNWEVDTSRYAGWQQLIKNLRDHDIRVMTYCNPCLAPTFEKPFTKKNLFNEAKQLGILVKNKDEETYMIPNTAFNVGMLDLTNPACIKWFKQVLHEMVETGVRGWMADFGEGLPLDSILFSGEDPMLAHNRYPELWAKLNREFIEEWKSMLPEREKEDPNESLVFFMRAGFRNSPKWATLFWEGDQMVSWQKNDGIKSAVIGLLSSGISGYVFNHSDIGGYSTVNLPIITYRRSEELLLRWMELNAFNVVFRSHEGNKPAANCQIYSNTRVLSQFARFAKVYKAWKFYRIQLIKEASEKGLPVCRHLFIHYPEDKRVQSLTYQQFLVGTEILVVPVLNKGQNKVKAYFPISDGCVWKHIWTGVLFGEKSNLQSGIEAQVEAPIGYPAVFVKSNSPIGETFVKNLRELLIL